MSSALTTMQVAAQTKLLQKGAATHVSGCRECQSLSLVTYGSSENNCVSCDQVDELLILVVELQEEVKSLRTIRESEKERDWWDHDRPSLRQKEEQPLKTPKVRGSCILPLG